MEAEVRPPAALSQASAPRVIISYIHFLGTTKRTQADEFIELKNLGEAPQDLSGWRISAADPGQNFVFPAGTQIAAGAVLRVYTNREPRSPAHFSFGSKRAIWNDAGDLGQLFDDGGKLVAQYGYGSSETRTLESIKEACGLSGLQLAFEPALLTEQSRPHGKVDFFTALERVLRLLTTEPAADKRDQDEHSRRILQQLNRQRLSLLPSSYLPYLADVKKNWFFGLHEGEKNLCRIVVDRSGAEPAYREDTAF